MLSKKKLLLIGAGISLFLILSFLFVPILLAPSPNSSWYLVIPKDPNKSSLEEQYDYNAVVSLENTYNIPASNIIMLSETTMSIFNKQGMNIIFIGGWAGQTALKDFAPWAEFWELSILQRPNVQPNVRWYGSGSNWMIQTPYNTYYPPDIGYIAVGYDSGLFRYIVIAIGWDANSTYKLAQTLPSLLPSITPGHYVVVNTANSQVLERG